MKKVSIVIAYHNRRKQFINTLNSILFQSYNCELEVIVIDDNSTVENNIEDLPELYPTLNMKVVTITKEEKWWVNPCIPYNKGFALATGDIIIIQNPESLHIGNIIQSAVDNIKDNKYLVFGCYGINKQEMEKISNLEYDRNYINKARDIIEPMVNRKIYDNVNSAWYQHSRWRPELLHFCSAITKKDLDELGGFDERFANGIAYDDREIILRIQRKRMIVNMIDFPFVLHQHHTPTNYDPKLTQRNINLMNIVVNEKIIKANG